jgi:hypothetical protein
MAEKVKRSALIKAAKELNEELGLKPPIDVKVKKEKEIEGKKFPFNEYLEQMVPQAFSMFDPEMDQLSNETIATCKALQPEKEETETSKPAGIPEGAEEVIDLTDLLTKTKKLADLKTLVGEYDVFEPLRDKLDDFAGLSGPRELRPEMEKCLGITPVKNITPKEAGKKRTGAISERVAFYTTLIEKGGFTKKELVEKAEKEFPDATKAALQTVISDGKNPKYNKFAKLLVEDENKVFSFAK